MDEKPFEKVIEREFGFLLEKGFEYEYLYDKGSDSSCVYIYRLKRGRDFFDFRAVSGGKTGTFVVCAKGEYLFPSLTLRHKKEYGAFKRKHFFRRATKEEEFALAAAFLKSELENGELFGIRI